MYRMKKTKIVATMSDFRCTEEFVKNLYDAGMDVVRVNSAHVTEDGATHIVETVHRVNPAIPIMIDTKGPEIRVTTIADEYGNTLDISAVPMLKSKTHLPVVIDPSHAAGIAWMVEPLAMAAIAAGADGLMIEVHNDPPHAKSDGAQSLTPAQFDALMGKVKSASAFFGKAIN